jgi:hypothetical protein
MATILLGIELLEFIPGVIPDIISGGVKEANALTTFPPSF